MANKKKKVEVSLTQDEFDLITKALRRQARETAFLTVHMETLALLKRLEIIAAKS